MLGKIRAFFQAEDSGTRTGDHAPSELRIAAAGLLLEAASTDGMLETLERNRVATAIGEHFQIEPDEVEEILEAGEKRVDDAVDIYGFVRIISEHFDEDERVSMMEMLWDVAYADGVLHSHEANLIRRVSGMLGMTDVETGAARKRVMARLGIDS